MEQAFVKLLDENLECIDYKLKNDKIILLAKSSKKSVCCPYCGCISDKVHSEYQREIQDIPMQDKQTILLLNTRKMFCLNKDCAHKTFSERFDFISSNGKKTKRYNGSVVKTKKLSFYNELTCMFRGRKNPPSGYLSYAAYGRSIAG